MGFELIFCLTVAYFLTRNTVQDLAWKARGEDPPSYRREQARWQARKERKDRQVGDSPTQQLFRNAWADAVAAADERRARTAEKAAAKRHAKWAEKDRDAAEDEARRLNDDIDPPVEPKPCGDCKAPLTPDQVAGYTDAADPLCGQCRTRERCHFCGKSPEVLWPIGVNGRQVKACPSPCWENEANRHKRPPTPDEPPTDAEPGTRPDSDRSPETAEDDPAPEEPDDAPSAEVIQFADWQRSDGAAANTTEETPMSEVAGLRSAIAFAAGSAASARQAVTQTEAAVSALMSGGTSGPALSGLQQAMENLTTTASSFDVAAAELRNHLQVAEAYEANQGAGNREFVTSD